jgi:hypothetical protein
VKAKSPEEVNPELSAKADEAVAIGLIVDVGSTVMATVGTGLWGRVGFGLGSGVCFGMSEIVGVKLPETLNCALDDRKAVNL